MSDPEPTASDFIARWKDYTGGDPRRVEILGRIAAIYGDLGSVLSDGEARAGERVRAGEAILKAIEMFARAVKVDLKARSESATLETSADIVEYARETRRRIDDALAALERRSAEDYQAACEALRRLAADRGGTLQP